MKKTLLLFSLLFLFTINTAAKSGDVAGKYYSTDIITTLNGVEIDAINIGGETLISAEDMKYYGFNVNWYSDKRELKISSLDHASNGAPPQVYKSSLPSGYVLGNYYETDIVTFLDNKPITAYNIGGRTYIHAEETRKHGFDAIWNGKNRTLTITSSKFAGYEYSILMTQGTPQDTEGIGAFKINFSNDKILGYGDAEYLTTSFNSHGNSYSVLLQFYQNEGLFYSSKLLSLLSKYADTDIKVKDEISLSVNGKAANDLIVTSYNGNGHKSFYIICNKGLKIKEEDIKSIEITVGENIPDKSIVIPQLETATTKAKKLFKHIKKNPLDRLESFYEVDEYFVLNVTESEKLGVIRNRLYVVDKNGLFSEDILNQVRAIEGYNSDRLRVYSTKIGAVKTNFFFSCASDKKNGDFYVELDTGTVHLISQRDK